MLTWLYATWPRDIGKAVEHTPCRAYSAFTAHSESLVSIFLKGNRTHSKKTPTWIKFEPKCKRIWMPTHHSGKILSCFIDFCISTLYSPAGLNLSNLLIPHEAALQLSNLKPFPRNYLLHLFRLKNSTHTHAATWIFKMGSGMGWGQYCMPSSACPPASPSAKWIGIHSRRRLLKQPFWLCRRGQTPTTNTIVLGPSGRSFTQSWSSSPLSGQFPWQKKLLCWPFSSWVCYSNGS